MRLSGGREQEQNASELALAGEIVCHLAAIYRARGPQNRNQDFLLVNNQEREAHANFTASGGWLLQCVHADNDWRFPLRQDVRANCLGCFSLLLRLRSQINWISLKLKSPRDNAKYPRKLKWQTVEISFTYMRRSQDTSHK